MASSNSHNESKEEMKQRMVDLWSSNAASYHNWVIEKELVKGLYGTFKSELVPVLQGQPGVRILDVASSSGEPAATLAAALPSAHVLSTDLAAAYQELGKARAARLGLTNLAFDTADAEDLSAFLDGTFDAVTCSLGIMFMPNEAKALAEFHRMLKPGGTLVLTAWGPEERNPFFGITQQLSKHYDPEAPTSITAIRFADPATLLDMMRRMGLQDVQCREVQVEFFLPSNVWWEALLDMPLAIKASVTKAQEARPGEDVFGEARERMQGLLADNGCLTPEGDLACRNNSCWFITAKKAN